jgi:hypothetical protein
MDDYLANAKAAAKARKRQKRKRSGQYTNTDPQIKFLRERICRLNYGTKIPDKVCPELTIKQLVARYNNPSFGNGRCGASLKNDQFYDHFAGRLTHYFWGDHLASTPEILVMLDFDACGHHGGGTSEGCWRFAEKVRDALFPGLYLEPSTNGQGVHGYLRLFKRGIRGDLVRQALKNLDRYLKRLALSVGADIACVEVKGLPPSVTYDDNGNIAAITFGQWAKLPRGRGVLDTCKVSYGDIALLDPDEIKVEPEQEEVIEKKAATKMRLGSFDSRVVRQETLDKLPELEKLSVSVRRIAFLTAML